MRSGAIAVAAALRNTLTSAAACGQPTRFPQAFPVLSDSVLRCISSSASESSHTNNFAQYAAAAAGVVAGVAAASTLGSIADEGAHGMPAPNYPWDHDGYFDAYDHGSIRRGHKVYQQVCAACHSMEYRYWRHMVDVCYTEAEVKALAADTEVTDGPNDEGEMFTRPGRPSDPFPSPYANEQQARYANGGAYPPDLSVMVSARVNGASYVFALLTGYRDPPAGVTMRQGLYYNPYFPGGAIAMPRMLADGGVEYDDGTPANSSQQAKDVVTFLNWSSYPTQDEMKQMGIKAIVVITLSWLVLIYQKRLRWAPLKSSRIVMDTIN